MSRYEALFAKLAQTANYPLGGSVADAKTFLKKEQALWSGIVKSAGIQPE